MSDTCHQIIFDWYIHSIYCQNESYFRSNLFCKGKVFRPNMLSFLLLNPLSLMPIPSLPLNYMMHCLKYCSIEVKQQSINCAADDC